MVSDSLDYCSIKRFYICYILDVNSKSSSLTSYILDELTELIFIK
jgi:hypothetical protein